ncbi:MAG: cobaltochelatase subunit CobN [Acidimicrobiales bacterium]
MILFLTHADTEILGLRIAAESLPEGFPLVRAANPALLGMTAIDLEGVEVVIVRLLGGRRSWEGFDPLVRQCRARGLPLLAFGGEAVPDAECMGASTVSGGVVTQAFEYLVQGGTANLAQLLRFIADTVLRHGFGFEVPVAIPSVGVLGAVVLEADRPTVGIVFYRAHVLTGNTSFVTELCDAIRARGANAVPVYCYSLRDGARSGESAVAALLGSYGVDSIVSTVLAAGTFAPGDEIAGGMAAEGWSEHVLGSLGVPIVQGMVSTSSAEVWNSSNGLAPLDVAWAIALPELDGRIISVPFSFKEVVDDGDDLGVAVLAYRTLADRVDRVAGLSVRLASLRRRPFSERRVAVVLSAYPTKASRLGNAVGLDTPASVIGLLYDLRAAGYQIDRIPESGDALMAELADGLEYDSALLTKAQVSSAPGLMETAEYCSWFESVPATVRDQMTDHWGEAPGQVHLSPEGDALVFSGIDLGGVLIAIQPPRGFGENPIASYHSPLVPPTHHYLAFYRWLETGFRADAIVHIGKHGTLEWLPGKGAGLSAACYPDLALGDVPLIYPFVVNDPGEGAQAKRRAHAVIVDHLVPPLTRADSYDEVARLEGLLDEHARIASLDPAKLPAIRRQVWALLVEAEIHRDLGLEARYGSGGTDVGEDDGFDELVLEIDGYLCELKDAQIRGGLHILGRPPEGPELIDFVLALTRLRQGKVPSLRAAVAAELGIGELAGASRTEMDRVEAQCRQLVEQAALDGWRSRPNGADERPGNAARDDVAAALEWVCGWLVPALCRTTDETAAILAALDGRHVPPGPSGAPSRGMAHVLPTGRNFYTLDPKAVPSRLSMDVGEALAARLVERHLADEGEYPRSVAIVVWGTAVMRTGGDDIAQGLALIGVRPHWSEESGRVEGLEVLSLGELGRPRVDVTFRISGLFRDAFPHVVALVDEAVTLVAGLDETPESNPLVTAPKGEPRIFGPAPGSYGSGILPVIEARNWRTDDDLAAVYLAWSGWSYGRSGMGVLAGESLARRLSLTEIAVKNQDNREHDIFDSDDYLQDHGGMIAAIRSLRGGVAPKAVFGDSSDPARARVRSLAEEAARVVRSRVLNPKWIDGMRRHGYKGAFEMAATVDYLFGYDATAHVVEDWMYERVTTAYVGDPEIRKFFQQSNPWALRAIAERLLEASERGMWAASLEALSTLRQAILEGEGWEEDR